MKTTLGVLGLLALIPYGAAQDPCLSLTTHFPACALPCVTSAANEVGCTAPADLACRCIPASSSAIQSKAVGCVIKACTNPGELVSAIGAGGKVCSCVRTQTTEISTTTTTGEETTTTTEEKTTTAEESTTTEASTTEPTITEPTITESTTEPTTTGPTTTEESTTDSGTTTGCVPKSPCQATADLVPDCAETCIFSAAVTAANCKTEDFECQCSASAVIQGAAQGCVIGGCGIATAIQALDSVAALCSCVTAHPTEPCATGGESTTTEDTTTEETSITATDETTTTSLPGTIITITDGDDTTTTSLPGTQTTYTSDGENTVSESTIETTITTVWDSTSTIYTTECHTITACPPTIPDCRTKMIITTTVTIPISTTICPVTEIETLPPFTEPAPAPTSSCLQAGPSDCLPVAASAVPKCAQPCFGSMAPKVGCGVDDFACQCLPEARQSLSQLLLPCVTAACEPGDLPAVITGANSVCDCAIAAPTGFDCSGAPGPGDSEHPKPTEKPSPPPPPPPPTGDNGGNGDDDESGTDGKGSGENGGDNGNDTPPPEPTDSPNEGGSGSDEGSGGSGGGGEGEAPPPPDTSEPAVVTAAASRLEFGIVAGFFGAAWLAAVAL